METDDKLMPLSATELRSLCDKKCPTIQDMTDIKAKLLAQKKELREIQKKMDASYDEIEEQLRSVEYFKKFIDEKIKLSN
jgi:hypothetical protein